MIQLHQISKGYVEGGTTHPVLTGLDLTIAAGEIIILMGKSGSGKSTLLNILSGIDLPDQGRVIVEDTEITALSEGERTLLRRRRMGFVFQAFNLIPTLTVDENLLLPLELNRIPGGEERIRSLLREVGLADRGRTFPDRLSGGEQQRVAIARALVHDPDIVLADEPTGNLDTETGRRIVDLLDATVRRRGTTLIMVTHSREVVGLADRVFALREGKLVPVPKEEVR